MGSRAGPTAGELLLLAVEAVPTRAYRAPWAVAVLVEQLVWALQDASEALAETSRDFIDPRRGVRERAIVDHLLGLAASGYISPIGKGVHAFWEIPASQAEMMASLWSTLTAREQIMIKQAAQRAQAIFDAWSNTCNALAESSEVTVTS